MPHTASKLHSKEHNQQQEHAKLHGGEAELRVIELRAGLFKQGGCTLRGFVLTVYVGHINTALNYMWCQVHSKFQTKPHKS